MFLLFSDFNYRPEEILQKDSIPMRNDFDFWKNTCQVKYIRCLFGFSGIQFFYIFCLHIIGLISRLENITNKSSSGL